MPTVTTSIKLTNTMEMAMLKQVVAEGYGFRGKSKWITEAVEGFLKLENYPELVDIADDIEMLNRVVSCRLPSELADRLDKAVINVRKTYPALEGVKSKIFRASILQRLIKNPAAGPVTGP